MLNGHGDEIYLYPSIKANFSSNVNYTGVNTPFKQYLFEQLNKVNNYPEVNSESLQVSVARTQGVTKEQVLVTNGATEAFYLIAQAYSATSATLLVPTFSEYEDACKLNNIRLTFITYSDISEDYCFNSQLVFICNPNNPTGDAIPSSLLKTIIRNNSGSTFIIDEAYIDFTQYTVSLTPDLNEFPNLIIVKSLTKAYSIPGLRLGYILGSKNNIDTLTNYKMPWSVNTLAIAAGHYILQQQETLRPVLETLLNDTQRLIEQLNTIANITAYPTHTHFFLCTTKKETAATLKAFLVNNKGLLIRDASNFRTLTPQHFRIATQTDEHNKELINGIKTWSDQL